jgi:UDP-N-acetylglucosamine 2-epimerase (hydrolysing)
MGKKILFLTGTRADFGKLKSLISATQEEHDVSIFATGMHMLARYGMTCYEISRSGFEYYPFINQDEDTPQDRILSNTVHGLSLYVKENRPDLIVVHGDRVEALAGAIVGNFNGILTAHIEGGELSGTVDGMIRHSITKLAHCHFCANEDAKRRLEQMGEENIYIIGSPDIDIMLSPNLPELSEVKKHYGIDADEYGILIYHPVVGEDPGNFFEVLLSVERCDYPFIAIYPNNDPGSQTIIHALDESPRKMYVLPSMRFEHFLTLLKHARVIVGNSSAGVREAPVYGVPTVNVGTRQEGRVSLASVVNVPDDHIKIIEALDNLPRAEPSLVFGRGDSAHRFVDALPSVWNIRPQKGFVDRV